MTPEALRKWIKDRPFLKIAAIDNKLGFTKKQVQHFVDRGSKLTDEEFKQVCSVLKKYGLK